MTTIIRYGDTGLYRMIRNIINDKVVNFSPLFYNPTQKLYLTSQSTGYSIGNDGIISWQNLDNQTLSFEQ